MNDFKIITGFTPEEYIPIDETELERAIYVHLSGSKSAFKNGSISGDKIHSVQPDFHRAMGWNRGYKLGPDDYAELAEKGVDKAHYKEIERARERVQYLVEHKQTDLIGKGVIIPELEKTPQFSNETKRLAAGMRINHD
jgi:hypothetical protein